MASNYYLFISSALIEIGSGVTLLFYPPFLFPDAKGGALLFASQMIGVAMISIGLAAYEGSKLRGPPQSSVALGLLAYNVGITAIGAISLFTGGFLPGPVFSGVTPLLRFSALALVHIPFSILFWFVVVKGGSSSGK